MTIAGDFQKCTYLTFSELQVIMIIKTYLNNFCYVYGGINIVSNQKQIICNVYENYLNMILSTYIVETSTEVGII